MNRVFSNSPAYVGFTGSAVAVTSAMTLHDWAMVVGILSGAAALGFTVTKWVLLIVQWREKRKAKRLQDLAID